MVKLQRTIESYFSNQSKTSNEAFSVQIHSEQTSENCETRRKKIVKCSDWNSSQQLQPNFPTTKQFKMKMNEKLLMGYGKKTIHGSSVGHFNGPALSLRGQ